MARGRSTSGIVISTATFILLEVAAIFSLRSSSELQNIWINRASHRVSGTIWKTGDNLRNYFSMKEKNRILQEENAILSAQLRHYKMLEEADSCQLALGAPVDGFSYIFAKTERVSIGGQHNHIILNKGWEDGVRIHSGIITDRGVVGIIEATDRNHSYGRTLMNPNISVSVRLGHSDRVGPMVWDGRSTSEALVQGIPLSVKTTPGDTVWTSGYSSIFPSGISVGTVKGSSTRNGATMDVKVNLLMDFSSVDFVTIVYNEALEEINSIEKREEAKR